jgi:hypothetical protein
MPIRMATPGPRPSVSGLNFGAGVLCCHTSPTHRISRSQVASELRKRAELGDSNHRPLLANRLSACGQGADLARGVAGEGPPGTDVDRGTGMLMAW